ncbi:MAG: hypothetical protein KTR14_05105 [Vampirovibrio sp.]|nr:hypothetical protein [Vampirovibrio sp.]
MNRYIAGLIAIVALIAAGIFFTKEIASANAPGHLKIFLYNQDYPTNDALMRFPRPADENTKFLGYLGHEFQTTNWLSLTETTEEADYRVDIKCAGIIYCTKLRVYVKSPDRAILSSYTLDIKKKPVEIVASDLANTLASRISKVEQGYTGDYETDLNIYNVNYGGKSQ